MRLGGVQKLTLLDFPEHVACTVFTLGCNLRCPFCHNASLVVPERALPDEMPEAAFFDFLQSRKKVLDGVCITGGEPLLQPDIVDFIKKIRALGFAVKLDTNGTLPHVLKPILDEKLVDYVAMDVKNSPARYAETVGVPGFDVRKIEESLALLRASGIPFELRTTVVAELHDDTAIQDIGGWIAGDQKYFLQSFADSGDILGTGFSAHTPAKMREFQGILAPFVPKTALRGI